MISIEFKVLQVLQYKQNRECYIKKYLIREIEKSHP